MLNLNTEYECIDFIKDINPLTAYILENSGLLKIQNEIYNYNFEYYSEQINKFINDNNFINAKQFISSVSNNKNDIQQIVFYCYELLINNYSNFSHQQIEKIFEKLEQMLFSQYDTRIENINLLIISCLKDLAIPSSISQQELNTCSVTCIQIQLVIRDPLEYLNIVDSLSQNKIYFSLKKQLIYPDWSFLEIKNDSRIITAKLFQTAIFSLCHSKKEKINKGISSYSTLKAYQILFGDNYKVYNSSDYTSEQMLEILKSSVPSKNNPVQISVNYADNGSHSLHDLNVINYDQIFQDIKVINPWGREEIIDLEVIKDRVCYITTHTNCDKRIARISDNFFSINIKSLILPWYKKLFISNKIYDDYKLNNYLNCLSLKQKTDMLVSLYSLNMRKKEKILSLKILDNILQGSDFQNKIAIEILSSKLYKKEIEFIYFIYQLEIDNDLFAYIIDKISHANPNWGNLINEMLESDFWELNSI